MPVREKHSSGLITTKAIVISSLKYAEADLIVKCFTESHGLKSYLLRNIMKSKKARQPRSGMGKLRAAMFQPLTQLEIVARHKDKHTLEYIREAKIALPYQNLHTNIYKSSMALFLSEVLRYSIQEEETNQVLFRFLEDSFTWLDQHEKIADFHLVFMVKLTRYLGFYPHLPIENHSYFNLEEGIFETEKNNYYGIGKENSSLLASLLKTNYETSKNLNLNQDKRLRFLEILLLYYELHLQGFRKPKSLEILHQVFE